MQLLLIALFLLMSGKNANVNQLKPIIEKFGGEQAANAIRQAEDAIKQAEEISGVLSAVASMAGGAEVNRGADNGAFCPEQDKDERFPLAPIASVADGNIMNCLSRYIALGE